MVAFRRTIPILRSFDELEAKAFYSRYLGFQLDWEHRFEADLPLYMQFSRDAIAIHVSEHHGDATPGSAVFIETTGVHDLHAEIAAKRHPNVRPGLERNPWGLSMTLLDPFGNRLTFNDREAT